MGRFVITREERNN